MATDNHWWPSAAASELSSGGHITRIIGTSARDSASSAATFNRGSSCSWGAQFIRPSSVYRLPAPFKRSVQMHWKPRALLQFYGRTGMHLRGKTGYEEHTGLIGYHEYMDRLSAHVHAPLLCVGYLVASIRRSELVRGRGYELRIKTLKSRLVGLYGNSGVTEG
ncbi:hypothetical protein B0H10DRAFT_1946673 [Mycena sp. CBHHK59/15]|nr:hypothetical protein B0H10DRAFT_1946673 [Mycena sp. CBHHK59/15]